MLINYYYEVVASWYQELWKTWDKCVPQYVFLIGLDIYQKQLLLCFVGCKYQKKNDRESTDREKVQVGKSS